MCGRKQCFHHTSSHISTSKNQNVEFNSPKIWYPLIPFSWLYGAGVYVRNFLFDCGILKSAGFDIPVISVGNITVGGTGKTPMTEYLIRLLRTKHQVSIVSRGYKRQTKGYVRATENTHMSDIGDEPYQMKQKYPEIHVAVDEKRSRAITNICQADVTPPTDVVLMDDGFQHRYVQPGINILLMDYNRLPHTDFLLPAGKLREPKSSCRRADIVIVTKCPGDITPTEEHGIERSLNLQPWQKLFYSHYGYGNLVPMRNYIDPLNDYSDFSFSKPQDITLDDLKANKYNVVLLTGIASPHQLESDFRQFCQFTPIRFEDHHNFTKKDIDLIASKTKQSESGNTIVVTTEKDAMRLIEYMRNNPGDDAEFIRNRYQDFYVLPVEVKFMKEKQDEFNQIILSYVQKNSRTSTLSKRP